MRRIGREHIREDHEFNAPLPPQLNRLGTIDPVAGSWSTSLDCLEATAMSPFFDTRGLVPEICAPQSKYVSGFMPEITTAGGQLG